MSDYDPKALEAKWQKRWAAAGVFRVVAADADRARFYALEMLPYPSGRIHMGHVRNYSIGDAVARFRRMRGEQVLHVIGWDAFGLPAENAAIQNNEEPRSWTLANIDSMRSQLQRLGIGYDWDREIATCLPEYYRWNQWLFLRMLERGIAFRARRHLNWCASCSTVLANEQVVAGRCWRCDNPVTRREFDQWFLKITAYAQELLDGIEELTAWPDRVRAMQRHWIGRSEGAKVTFAVEGGPETIEVFTTRIDTIHGATYVAMALEHPLLQGLAAGTPHQSAVRAFVAEQEARSVEDRFAETGDKLGVFIGRHAVNPFNGERIPIWAANFVLMDVGTGAIMSVPAHDARDHAFATAYGLPIRPVIRPADAAAPADVPFTDDGILVDSGPWSGLASADARVAMIAEAAKAGFGESTVAYRLKDWGISRQRYWGTPIPVVHCPSCGVVPVPDDQLPVRLPDHAPLTGSGGSPLALMPEFVNTACPRCGEPAARETDTMDTFVDSCWYYFRYCDPKNGERPFDWQLTTPWFPVNLYIGGIEHATMHLIYTRFWTKVMRDLGLVTIDEPVDALFTQGMVIKDGAKMSKSKGNVVDPDLMIERYGADTTRLFSLFAAPPERDLEWSDAGIEGCYRFLGRLWRAFEKARPALPAAGTPPPAGAASGDALALRRKTHQTIRRITDDLGPRMHLNTPVAAIMELLNTATPLIVTGGNTGAGDAWALREAFETIARVMAPFAPHVAEELWESLGHEPFVATAAWPEADPALLTSGQALVVVQVNGKVRGKLDLPAGTPEAVVLSAARADGRIAAYLDGKPVRKIVFVPDRLMNVVIE